jgi:hypothetical protein
LQALCQAALSYGGTRVRASRLSRKSKRLQSERRFKKMAATLFYALAQINISALLIAESAAI